MPDDHVRGHVLRLATATNQFFSPSGFTTLVVHRFRSRLRSRRARCAGLPGYVSSSSCARPESAVYCMAQIRNTVCPSLLEAFSASG